MTLLIIVWSKSKASLNHFVLFWKRYLCYNSNIIAKYFQNKTNTKTITVLKSPHVNKKSQEQFEIKTFKKHFKIIIKNDWKLLLCLKKLSHNMCSDINIKVKESFTSKFFFKRNVNLKNFKIRTHYNSSMHKIRNFRFKKNLNYLKKNTMLNFIISKKTNQLFLILNVV